MTYGRILLLGLTLFFIGGAVGGRWGGYLAVAAFLGTPLAAFVLLSLRPGGVKDAEAKLAAIEQLPETDDEPTRWERKQRLVPRWNPASPEQAAAVRRLVDEHRGALVRVRTDRSADVLTATKSEELRYEVDENGVVRVTEQAARDRSGRRLGLGGSGAFLLGWALAAAGQDTPLEWVAGVLLFGGFVSAALGFLISGSERTEHGALLRTRRGERWTSIGYPED